MSESISSSISDRICKHMNEDHHDSLVLYAKVYGNVQSVEQATMLSLDAEGMNLSVKVNHENKDLRIEFDRPLKDARDAHHTLIDMLKKARTIGK
jgi:putative heme iron utilization protein